MKSFEALVGGCGCGEPHVGETIQIGKKASGTVDAGPFAEKKEPARDYEPFDPGFDKAGAIESLASAAIFGPFGALFQDSAVVSQPIESFGRWTEPVVNPIAETVIKAPETVSKAAEKAVSPWGKAGFAVAAVGAAAVAAAYIYRSVK